MITKITEGCSKKHFSFATKFCHYACLYLLEGEYRDTFPIFDTIMRINLEKYSDTWKSTTIKVNNKETEIKKLEEYKDVDLTTFYKTYVKVISDLAKENKISKTGVEQLIWYYHNGD